MRDEVAPCAHSLSEKRQPTSASQSESGFMEGVLSGYC